MRRILWGELLRPRCTPRPCREFRRCRSGPSCGLGHVRGPPLGVRLDPRPATGCRPARVHPLHPFPAAAAVFLPFPSREGPGEAARPPSHSLRPSGFFRLPWAAPPDAEVSLVGPHQASAAGLYRVRRIVPATPRATWTRKARRARWDPACRKGIAPPARRCARGCSGVMQLSHDKGDHTVLQSMAEVPVSPARAAGQRALRRVHGQVRGLAWSWRARLTRTRREVS